MVWHCDACPQATLRDRLLKQAFRERAGDQMVHRHRTGGLACDGHLVRIATECGCVCLDPLERGDLVHEAVVARSMRGILGIQFGMREEAIKPHAVIDRDHHDPFRRKLRSVIDRHRIRSARETAAVYPHHHRQLRIGLPRRGPHVEVEAVFADLIGHDVFVRPRAEAVGCDALLTARRQLIGLAHAAPCRRRPRRLPAIRSGGRSREWHAEERRDLTLGYTRKRSLPNLRCRHFGEGL